MKSGNTMWWWVCKNQCLWGACPLAQQIGQQVGSFQMLKTYVQVPEKPRDRYTRRDVQEHTPSTG